MANDWPLAAGGNAQLPRERLRPWAWAGILQDANQPSKLETFEPKSDQSSGTAACPLMFPITQYSILVKRSILMTNRLIILSSPFDVCADFQQVNAGVGFSSELSKITTLIWHITLNLNLF